MAWAVTPRWRPVLGFGGALPLPSGRFSPSVVPFLRGVFVCLTRPLARIKHEVKGFPGSVYSGLGRGVRWRREGGVTPVPKP